MVRQTEKMANLDREWRGKFSAVAAAGDNTGHYDTQAKSSGEWLGCHR